jgi:hypothetical protein
MYVNSLNTSAEADSCKRGNRQIQTITEGFNLPLSVHESRGTGLMTDVEVCAIYLCSLSGFAVSDPG